MNRSGSASLAGAPASLLLGFGTDGADRQLLPWLAQNLAAIFTVLLSVVLIAALAVLLYAIVRELRRNTVFLDPISVPARVAARGYTPEVVAEHLLDALLAMQRQAPTLKELRGVDASAALIDLQVPGRLSLQAIVRYVHRLLRIPEAHVGGDITRDGDTYELTLRSRDQREVTIVGVHRHADLRPLLTAGAEDILRVIDPWILAHHWFAQETRERPPAFTRTLATLEHMLQRAPVAEQPWAMNMQGICLMQQRRLPEAIACFRAAAAAGPTLPFIHQNWASALDLMGRFDEARAQRVRALEIPARTANLVANNAVNASSLHRHRQAVVLARRALALGPKNARAWGAWGQVLFGLHRLEQAASACERALALGARDMFWSPPLAMVYAALGQADRALGVARGEIERAGRTEEALKAIAFAQLAAGDATRAIASFDEALADSPGAGDAAYGKGDALLAQGETEPALEQYVRAVAIDPLYPQAHTGWARALCALGRTEEALARYAVAVRVDPAYPPAYRGWAEALLTLGRDAEAQEKLAEADAIERRNCKPLAKK
jgi:tetratricopeptide (TPR) repeat protein